jgi:phosphohistidine phosphatase SixA
LLAEKVGSELRTARWLSSGATPEAMLEAITEYRNLESSMLVGHEPDFSQFAAHLVGAPHGENIRIRKATLMLFTVLEFRRAGARLEFSIPAKLL